ncbi:MAG TPA: tetratricopeptide repeat protein [Pyrinomonadaceae bacterium]|nr:tetratricopeptide repeat protein [Pyrinomonadaceae bacterium]
MQGTIILLINAFIGVGIVTAQSDQTGVPPVLQIAKPSATPAKPTAKRIKQKPAPQKSQLGPSWPATQPLEVTDKAAIEETRPRELFEKALDFFRAGKPQDAVPFLREAEKLAPKRFEIQMLLGVTFGALRQRDEALSAFQKAVSINPQNADAHSGLCSALTAVDKRFDAIDECREAIKLAPARPRFRAQLAELYLGDNRASEALQLLMEADARSQADLVYMGTLGDTYFVAGNYELAADVYEKIAQKWPSVSVVYLRLADVYDYLGRLSDSITAAKRFAELEPKLVDAHLRLGQKYEISGFIDEAIDAYSKATALDPNCGEAYIGLSQMYEITGDRTAMLDSLRNAYRLLPRTVPLALKYGAILTENGFYVEAIVPLEWANSVQPNWPDIMRPLAFAYTGANRFDEGAALMEQANQISPLPPNIKINLDPKERRDLLDRFEDLKLAVKNNPNDVKSRSLLMRAYSFKGMVKETEEHFLEIVRLAPTYLSYNGLAVFYQGNHQYEKALVAIRKAVELNQHHVLYMTMSNILAKLGKIDEAVTAAEKSIQIKPTSSDLHLLLGDLLLKKGDRGGAIREYQAAFELASGEARPNFSIAWLYIRMGNKEGAFRHYSILRGIVPERLEYLESCLLGRFGELP